MKFPVRSALFGLVAALIGGNAWSEEAPSPTETPSPSPTATSLDLESGTPQFFGEPGDVAQVTRSGERIEDAPGLIAVIGEREIRERNYRTLADLLADVPGFYVERDP